MVSAPARLNAHGALLAVVGAQFLEVLARSLGQEDVLLAERPLCGDRAGLNLVQRRLQMRQDGLAVLEGELVGPGEGADGRKGAVTRVEVLEAHPVREATRH